MRWSFRIFISLHLLGGLVSSCATQGPRLYDFDDMEVFPAPFAEVWQVVNDLASERKWSIDETGHTAGRAYLTTNWITDNRNGGDYGSVGISLSKGNKPLNDKTREVALSIRVVSESESTTRVKVMCLFRIGTSAGHSGTAQSMFGTSKGIVENQILDTIRSRLVLAVQR